jgi:glycosyltransferase involved in cell wall biosynthesis
MHLAVLGCTNHSPSPAQAAELGLEGRVHFLGYQRDVAHFMRSSDLFVFPSRYEACSLVLLEALASGLPAITAKTTGGSELVDTSCGHVLDDPEDTASLVEVLRRLTESAAERRRLSLGAREKARQHSWASMAAEYIRLFHDIVDKPQRSIPALVTA